MATRRDSYKLAIANSPTEEFAEGRHLVVNSCLKLNRKVSYHQSLKRKKSLRAIYKWFEENVHRYSNLYLSESAVQEILYRLLYSTVAQYGSVPRRRKGGILSNLNMKILCDPGAASMVHIDCADKGKNNSLMSQTISFPSSIQVPLSNPGPSSSNVRRSIISKEITEIYSHILASNALIFNGCLAGSADEFVCELHLQKLDALVIPDDVFPELLAQSLAYIFYVHHKLRSDGANSSLHLVIDALTLPTKPYDLIKLCSAAIKLLARCIPNLAIKIYWILSPKIDRSSIDMDLTYDTAQITSDILSMEELHSQISASDLSTELGGEKSVKGEDFVAFRRDLEGLLGPCRTVGELYVDLSKDLKSSRTLDLWNTPLLKLENLLESIRCKFDEIQTDESYVYLRQCGESHLQRIRQLYSTLDQNENTKMWMRKVEGFYSELRKVMDKTTQSVERRCSSLNTFIEAQRFVLEAEDLLDFIHEYAMPTADKFRNESTVNVTRIRVQERQLEQLIAKAKARFDQGEKLLLDNEHIFAHSMLTTTASSSSALCRLESLPEEFSDSLSLCSSSAMSSSASSSQMLPSPREDGAACNTASGPTNSTTLTAEHKMHCQKLWQRLLDSMETAQKHLQSVRDFLADSLVYHNMINKVYDWALHNAKWGSQLGLVTTTPPPNCEETRKLLKLVQDQLDSYPDAELTQLPVCAKRLQDEQLLTQANSLQSRCTEALQVLHNHRQRIHDVLEETDRRLRDASPSIASTQYEQPMRKMSMAHSHTETNQYAQCRRSSYAGTCNSTVNDVGENYSIRYRPLNNRQSGDWAGQGEDTVSEEDDINCDVITQDMTHQVVSTMSHNTLKKKLEERRAENVNQHQTNGNQHAPPAANMLNPPINHSNDDMICNSSNLMNNPSFLDRASRPGSARQSQKNKKPFRKLMKRSTTNTTVIADTLLGIGHNTLCRATGSSELFNRGRQPSLQSLASMDDESLHSGTSSLSETRNRLIDDNHSGEGNSEQSGEVNSSSSSPPPFAPPPFTAPGMVKLPTMSQLPEDATPSQRMQHMILCELLHTEVKYVASLNFVIECYVPEMMRDDLPQELRGQRHSIFGNIEKINDYHVQKFLPQLKKRISTPSESVGLEVAKCFLDHKSDFHLYALYNKNKPKSDILMSDCGSVFFSARQLILGDKMDLASYLLKPVQRMGKYALLLQQLMKCCPDDDQETKEALRKAEQMVSFQLRHGNDLLAMDMIRNCDLNLKEQGTLLRQDEFVVFEGKGIKCTKNTRRVFLFEKMVLFAKPRRLKGTNSGSNLLLADTYQYKHSVTMADCGLTETIKESTLKFELWVRKHTSMRFVCQAPSTSVRKEWVDDIAKLLWRQAFRNREDRLAELSSMGIGRENCKDLKASEDRIEDRSVSSALINTKGTRFRQSFTSLKEVRLCDENGGNKRPHSLISVSSSSCSSSNTNNSLNSNTSTATPLSCESGICADLEPLEETAEETSCLVMENNTEPLTVQQDVQV